MLEEILMKMSLRTLFTVLFALIFSISLPQASFALVEGAIADPSEIGVGARPLGMGKAFVAVADDGSAIYINPSGLGGFKTWKFTSMSGSILQDVNYVVLGAAAPFQFGTLGLGYINVGVPDIPLTTLTGAGTPEFTGRSANYNAGLFFLSYGSQLDRFVPYEIAKNINVGANAKFFLQGFTGGGASLEGASGSGFDMDLGMEYKFSKWGTFGLNYMNCLNRSMGGKFVWPAREGRDEIIEEAIPDLLKVGVSAKVWGKEGLNNPNDQDLVLALDTDISPSLPRPSVWHVGIEWWPVRSLALRAGLDQKPTATISGVGVASDLTVGVGIKLAGYTFDYAYHPYGDLAENVSHYFSIGYVGEERVEKKKETMEQIIKPSQIPTEEAPATSEALFVPTVKPKPVLKTFIDVPYGYWAKDAIEYLSTIGVLGGYPDNTFRPEAPLSRAELSAILVRARDVEPLPVTEDPFPDLPANHWAAKYVRSAVDLRLVSGYPDGRFQPAKPVTRSEGIVIITRFAEVPPATAAAASPFPDLPKAHWAFVAVLSAWEAGMLDYLSGKNFEPSKNLTRGEVAQILSKTPWGKMRIKDLLGAR